MRRAATLLLVVVSPVLIATDISMPPDEVPKSHDEKRELLEQFNREIDGMIEFQIEEIATLLPTREIEDLREAHDAWELKREVTCSEKSHSDADKLAELDCRSIAAEEYYQELEAQIAALEKMGDGRHSVPDTLHNKRMQTDEPRTSPSRTPPP